jgi:hypothetical protein
MFGPSVHTLQGQRVVLCRGRGDHWADWVAHSFTARGLVITETTAAQHDRAMSVVQVLTHFQTQVQGLTLTRLGVPLAETLPFTSPAYLLELYVAARHFAQDPGLYGPIEMLNPRTSEVTAAYGGAGSIDGTIPGRYWINLRTTKLHSRYSLADLTFHEAIPGHIWQGEYTHAQPLIRQLLAFNAFSEGWALYAEQLEKQMELTGRLNQTGWL